MNDMAIAIGSIDCCTMHLIDLRPMPTKKVSDDLSRDALGFMDLTTLNRSALAAIQR